jgi:hypothetical protein
LKCSVAFSLSDLNRDITCAQALQEQALPELVPQVPQVLQVLQVLQALQALQVLQVLQVLVPEPLLLS